MVVSSRSLLRLSMVVWSLLTLIALSVARDDAPVSGVYKGNGKEAKLAYASAARGTGPVFEGYIILTLTEKDHSKEKQPHIRAQFGHFGSALVVRFKPDGKVSSSNVAHIALEKSGFATASDITMSDFKMADGKIKGKLSTKGEQKSFDETWEVNLSFQVKAP